MRDRKTINTFTLTQPVDEQVIELVLCLFSNHSFQSRGRFSYSIVGKINGFSGTEGSVKITADYHSQTTLTDNLSMSDNGFIYCNQSSTPFMLDINLQFNGILPWQGAVNVNFRVKLRYSSGKFSVHAINNSYSIKSKTKPKIALMQ